MPDVALEFCIFEFDTEQFVNKETKNKET